MLAKIKYFISSVAFKAFLWASDTTEERYWSDIYEQEKLFKEYSNKI